MKSEEKVFPENQINVLQKLIERPYKQKELAEALGLSGAGLSYHLDILEKEEDLIRKTTTLKVGNVSLNEISLNPNAIQRVRKILKKETGNYTLISGFGKDSTLGESHMLPIYASDLLKKEGYNISRIVVFITPESNLKKAEELVKFDKVINKPYVDYRNLDSDLMKNIESIIQEEQKLSDLILDLTPLTKLLTIKLMELSTKYRIPSMYLGKKGDNENYLLWIYQSNHNH